MVSDDGKSASTDLLHTSGESADSGGVPARADELVSRGPLGSRTEKVRARRVAERADLSATV